MVKQFYRIIVSVIVFIVSIYIFGSHITERSNDVETISKTANATFPVLYMKVDDRLVNPMHGYTANMDAKYIRDGIISIDDKQKCVLNIKENDVNIKKAVYEISKCDSSDIIDTGTIRTFDKKDKYMQFNITANEQLIPNQEYALKVALVTDKGNKIYYYARIKRNDDTVDDKIIDFALDFHEKTLKKDKAEDISQYLETDASVMENKDLAYVNIKSNLETISFGELNPKVISDEFVTIREVTGNTAVLEIKYYMEANTDTGNEKYEVKEGYRIRWTEDRIYLLYFERSMESIFDIQLTSASQAEFKLGITNDTGTDITTSNDNSKIYFVRNGELWYYNAPTNDCAKVFSFKQDKDTDYFRDVYDAHNIKVLNVEDNGDAYFMVYGYMNRGDYEGRMAIVLYKHYVEQNRIEEQVNIPVDIPYAVLNQKVSDFAYVSDKEVFYFSIAEDIYAYDLKSSKMTTIAEGIEDEDMVLSKEGGFLAWQDAKKGYEYINVMKLRDKKVTKMNAPEGKCIKLLGEIQGNMIYGYADKNEVAQMMDGTDVVPIYEMNIATIDGKVAKTYKPKNCFVIGLSIENNRMILARAKQDSSGKYVTTSSESIFNNQFDENSNFGFTSRASEKTLTEWYMYIPDGYEMKEIPKVRLVENTLIKGDTTVRVYKDLMNDKYYFVYSYHGLESGYSSAAEAIVAANERMGNVFDNHGYLVWERGIANMAASVSEINEEGTSNGSINACVKMLVEKSGNDVKLEDISKVNGTIEDKVDKYVNGTAINFTGTPLNELMYSISKGRPVLAMMSGDRAVLITGYTGSSITYYDPASRSKKTMSKSGAEEDFKKVGNVFVSYIN